ncbi:hypothetical protein Tco_0574116 [Tanacetum coccineum]
MMMKKMRRILPNRGASLMEDMDLDADLIGFLTCCRSVRLRYTSRIRRGVENWIVVLTGMAQEGFDIIFLHQCQQRQRQVLCKSLSHQRDQKREFKYKCVLMRINSEVAEEEQAKIYCMNKKQSLQKEQTRRLDYEAASFTRGEKSREERFTRKLWNLLIPRTEVLCSTKKGGYSIKKLKLLSFEQVKEIFETTMRRVQYFVPMDSELEDKRLKRACQKGLEEPAKRQKIGEASGLVQEQSDEEPKIDELSQEQLQQMMIIVPRGINC